MTTRLNEERTEYLTSNGYKKSQGTARVLNNPEKISEFMREAYETDTLPNEHVWMICTNVRRVPIGVFELTKGTPNASIVTPDHVYRLALMSGATNIILVHNHPSGDESPSPTDYKTTERLIQAGNLLNIEMTDHIILGNGYYSMRERQNWLWDKKEEPV